MELAAGRAAAHRNVAAYDTFELSEHEDIGVLGILCTRPAKVATAYAKDPTICSSNRTAHLVLNPDLGTQLESL